MFCQQHLCPAPIATNVYQKSDWRMYIRLTISHPFSIPSITFKMKTLILDSSPGIHIKNPDNIPLNVSPVYKSRGKGQPLLGQKRSQFSHFVTLGSHSNQVKELLKVPESEILDTKPVESFDELIKAEKIATGNTSFPPKSQATNFYDAGFEHAAKEYVKEPQLYQESSYHQKHHPPLKITEKNDAEVANIIAAAQPNVKPIKAKPRQKKKPTPRAKAKPQKKKDVKTTSMKSFRVLGSNKV